METLPGEKFQKAIRYQRRQRRKGKRMTKHHNKAKSLGGRADEWNLYKLSEEHHAAYHKLFGLRTFDEAAQVLLRMQELHNLKT